MSIDKHEIEQALLVVYQKNLDFLKKNFPDIFLQIQKLSEDISNGKYEETYSLEIRDGYFDILNLKNNGYYYASNSYQDAEDRAKNVDTSNSSSIDLLRKQGTSQYLSYPSGLKNILPVVDFINKEIDLENIKFQKIMKFIYMGVGLGYHLQEIDKKICSYTTLIIEPELEIFRLSLFTIDYTSFNEGTRTLLLNVGDDPQKRDESLRDFYLCHEYMNYNIKYYKLIQNYEYIKEEAIEFFRSNFSFSFPYTSVIKNVKRTISFIRNKDNFLVVSDIKEQNIFKDKEVLLISAGPSLDNYIELIKKYQDKFVIVCVDVILRKLEKHGIIPNVVFSIDPSPLCAGYLKTEDPQYLKNSAIVLLSQQHPDVMKLLRERNLNYYFSQFSQIIDDIGYLGSLPNVGTFTFQTIVHMGAKTLYLIGNDAAFDQETGSRYTKDSSYIQVENLNIEEKNNNLISHEDIVTVKGNLRKSVNTNRDLLSFKYHFDTSIRSLENHYLYEAYNLSDGVLIDGLNPMKKEEFIMNAQMNEIIIFDTVKQFDSISKEIDSTCYEDDIKILNAVILRAKKFQKQKISSRDDFLMKKLDMMIWILERSKELSIDIYGSIFLQYTSMVDAYINFTLNLKQKDLYTRNNLEEISNYWIKGVISVFRDMKDSVSK